MEKETLGTISFLTVIVLFIILFSWTGYVYIKGHACLEPIARSFCEEKNETYISNDLSSFSCKEDLRSTEDKQYIFLEEEKRLCKR